MDIQITNYIGEWPHGKTLAMSVLECGDFGGSTYWTVFDPRGTGPMIGEVAAKQIRCDSLEQVQALMAEIAQDAVKSYIEWMRKVEEYANHSRGP